MKHAGPAKPRDKPGLAPNRSSAAPSGRNHVAPDPEGVAAAARVLAAGGRVPKKFTRAQVLPAQPANGSLAPDAPLSPARRAAFEILLKVGRGKGHSDELLHDSRHRGLSEPDRNLATALVMGVLRWQIALDARLLALLNRPNQVLAEPVALALRLGAFQLLHLDRIPAHAALSESVELCRAAGQPQATGMVNAVLRRLIAAVPPASKVFELPAAFAERLGHPAWLVERWTRNFGRENALKICEADQQEPEPGGLFAPDPGLPEIDDGSRLVAELAAASAPPLAERALRVWDCCAAPGGKTLVLAERLPEAEILATDVSEKRLARMRQRLEPAAQAARVKFRVHDARSAQDVAGDFDLILCDVPCSGTGTLARNPEIRLRLTVEELARQATRQREILAGALQRLAPGGRLVYSTCSLEPEENDAVIAAAAEGFRRVPVAELLAAIPTLKAPHDGLIRDGFLRTLPGRDPCDGFFAAVLERPL